MQSVTRPPPHATVSHTSHGRWTRGFLRLSSLGNPFSPLTQLTDKKWTPWGLEWLTQPASMGPWQIGCMGAPNSLITEIPKHHFIHKIKGVASNVLLFFLNSWVSESGEPGLPWQQCGLREQKWVLSLFRSSSATVISHGHNSWLHS